MKQWLTLSETALELRVTQRTIVNLLKRGLLQGIQVQPSRNWRIVPPSPRLRRHMLEAESRLEHVPLLSTSEVAGILNISRGAIKTYVKRKRIHPAIAKRGQPSLFAANEVRRFLLARETFHRNSKKVYSPRLAEWLKAIIDRDAAVEATVLDRLLQELCAYAPEEEQPFLLAALWKHVDGLGEVVRRLRGYKSSLG